MVDQNREYSCCLVNVEYLKNLIGLMFFKMISAF
jgi:hypothetical protein